LKVLQRLLAKPWEHAGDMEGIHGGNVAGRPPGRTGLYLFLGVVTSLFLLFSISHQMRSSYPDWAAVAEPGILWFNTGILLLASISLQLASNAAAGGSPRPVRNELLAASVFSLLFLGGQVYAWKLMLDAGLYAAGNPANAFFYMFTAIHAAHLLGGMWFLLKALQTAFTEPDDTALPNRIGLCATYWHFLLLVWALLFYLLLSS
jgi:cytochrome c oxidase subunit III